MIKRTHLRCSHRRHRRQVLILGLGTVVLASLVSVGWESSTTRQFDGVEPQPPPQGRRHHRSRHSWRAFYEDVMAPAMRGPPKGPPLYSFTRGDRAGMVVTEMLNAYAYCFERNLVYGGSCPRPGRPPPRHQAKAVEILQALGLYETESPLRFVEACPTNSTQGKVLDQSVYDSFATHKVWTPPFVRHVQRMVNVKPGYQDDNTLYTVAVHVRRGDVHPCHHADRYLPDGHYIRLLDLYLPKKYRHAHQHVVHVFSESQWAIENFTAFSKQSIYNVILHLDSDLAAVWQTMATADMVLTSKSSFSLVPAMLNQHGTVVYTRYPRTALPDWIKSPKYLEPIYRAEVENLTARYCDKREFNPWLLPED